MVQTQFRSGEVLAAVLAAIPVASEYIVTVAFDILGGESVIAEYTDHLEYGQL